MLVLKSYYPNNGEKCLFSQPRHLVLFDEQSQKPSYSFERAHQDAGHIIVRFLKSQFTSAKKFPQV